MLLLNSFSECLKKQRFNFNFNCEGPEEDNIRKNS